MSARNRRTNLRAKIRTRDPMQDFDCLPPELRNWLAGAALPWRPGSVQKVFARALARTGDTGRALAQLDAAERKLVARDAAAIWGPEHPAARGTENSVADGSGRG
ncbi:DUF6525 family protein [Roseinatronobacter sp.]|uniref:DUF6525 family protein n=1 Tax=Roseinatronobacter sp. TaxID=1945755 RepID=UPI0025FD32C4|nr:DUF6525 family protein [Roseibaca sp.]